MSLPVPTARKPTHTRTLTLQGFERADGLWDLEGHITDTKANFFSMNGCVREPGQPVHEMHVRLTIDTSFQVHDAVASAEAMPYPGHCDSTLPDYKKLIGLNLGKGFRRAALQRMGGTKGCTHITELLTHLPSAAYQTLAAQPEMYKPGESNFAVGRCVALKQDGEMVQRHYPRWYVGAGKSKA